MGRDMIGEYCRWEVFNAECEEGYVVMMLLARYGRMRFGRCMQEDHGDMGCHVDILSHMDALCTGRSFCRLKLPHPTFHSIMPCHKEVMPYMEASYTCVQVQQPQPCFSPHQTAVVKSEKGSLMLYQPSTHPSVTITTPGSPFCSWVIRGLQGQKVNFTLFTFQHGNNHAQSDFQNSIKQKTSAVQNKLENDDEDGDNESAVTQNEGVLTSKACHEVKMIFEEVSGKIYSANMCGFESRLTHVYTSETHEVSVFIAQQKLPKDFRNQPYKHQGFNQHKHRHFKSRLHRREQPIKDWKNKFKLKLQLQLRTPITSNFDFQKKLNKNQKLQIKNQHRCQHRLHFRYPNSLYKRNLMKASDHQFFSNKNIFLKLKNTIHSPLYSLLENYHNINSSKKFLQGELTEVYNEAEEMRPKQIKNQAFQSSRHSRNKRSKNEMKNLKEDSKKQDTKQKHLLQDSPSPSEVISNSNGNNPSKLLIGILHYEVTGCENLKIDNAVTERYNDHLTVKCNFSDGVYNLICDRVSKRWKGNIGLCEEAAKVPTLPIQYKPKTNSDTDQGVLVVIGSGVAIGVACGVFILFAMVLCHRKNCREAVITTTTTNTYALGNNGKNKCNLNPRYAVNYNSLEANNSLSTSIIYNKNHNDYCIYSNNNIVNNGDDNHADPSLQACLYGHAYCNKCCSTKCEVYDSFLTCNNIKNIKFDDDKNIQTHKMSIILNTENQNDAVDFINESKTIKTNRTTPDIFKHNSSSILLSSPNAESNNDNQHDYSITNYFNNNSSELNLRTNSDKQQEKINTSFDGHNSPENDFAKDLNNKDDDREVNYIFFNSKGKNKSNFFPGRLSNTHTANKNKVGISGVKDDNISHMTTLRSRIKPKPVPGDGYVKADDENIDDDKKYEVCNCDKNNTDDFENKMVNFQMAGCHSYDSGKFDEDEYKIADVSDNISGHTKLINARIGKQLHDLTCVIDNCLTLPQLPQSMQKIEELSRKKNSLEKKLKAISFSINNNYEKTANISGGDDKYCTITKIYPNEIDEISKTQKNINY